MQEMCRDSNLGLNWDAKSPENAPTKCLCQTYMRVQAKEGILFRSGPMLPTWGSHSSWHRG